MNILIPVVISGGAGTRLWPVSREGHPKPFMKLLDGETLLEKTYRRANKLPSLFKKDGMANIITVTNRDYYFMSRDELKKTGANGTFLLEPFGRDTAPAIALAAHQVRSKYGLDALMLIMSADHLIQDDSAFVRVVTDAITLAGSDHNYLVTFGILPTSPETGYGYIESGDSLGTGNRVTSFVEKPNIETAKLYLRSGKHYWNSGIFCCNANKLLKEIEIYAPNVAKICNECWHQMEQEYPKESSMLEIPEELFKQVPNISIDYAVMEKSSQVAVIPSEFGWNDIGTWSAIRDLISPDHQNNRALGEVIFMNSSNTFVQSEDRIVAAVGLENLMIVDTTDALLVINPVYSQDVKKVVSILKEQGNDAFKLHKTVARPWGTYTILEESVSFKIKRIEVKPGASLSLQMHHHRSEHWIVVTGTAKVYNEGKELFVSSNESTYIPAGHRHRLSNDTEEDLVLIEVQCGLYLGEDDIVRYDDKYGRV